MSDANPMAAFGDFGKWVPGFEFLKGLGQAGGQRVPPLAGWVAPTLSVEELDKRIQELRTVLFWLEQNSTALKATIQAMEVQKMTLATLQGMNVSLQEMAQAFSAPMPAAPGAGFAAAPAAPASGGFAGLEVPPLKTSRSRKPAAGPATDRAASRAGGAATGGADGADGGAAQAQAAPGLVDPMQWWGALTQQFQAIAQQAVKESAARPPEPAAAAKAAPAAPAMPVMPVMPGMQLAADLAQQASQVLAASTGRKPASRRNAAPARKTAARPSPTAKTAAPARKRTR